MMSIFFISSMTKSSFVIVFDGVNTKNHYHDFESERIRGYILRPSFIQFNEEDITREES